MAEATLQNVVVVGAASAGVLTAQNLAKALPATHRVVLIEANPVAYWSIGALRASVQPGFEQKVVHDLSSTTIFGAGTRHIVLAGTRVVELHPDFIVVNRDVTAALPGSTLVDGQSDKSRIAVDKVALAIGADYGFPNRIDPSARTKDDVLNQFRRMQKAVAAAQEILVVGGGPTGVEFVGEVLDEHPNKVVTLITRGAGVVTNGNDAFGSVSSKLLSQLRAKGVRVLLNDSIDASELKSGPLDSPQTFTTQKGASITADFVLLGSGGKPNTAWLDPAIVDAETKLIKVTPTFSIPVAGWERYYAAGDAAATPGGKTTMMAQQHAPQIAHNIAAAVKGEPESKLKKAGGPPGSIMVVPFGKSGGASQLMFFSAGGWLTGLLKGKSLLVNIFDGWFKA